jgi:hypothetical protein
MDAIKRVPVLALAFVLMVGIFPFAVYADTGSIGEDSTLPELWEYQEVIDCVNAELGSDFAFVTAEESELYDIPMPDPEHLGSLEDFEANIRDQITTTQAWNAEAAAATASAQAEASVTVTTVAYPIFDENGKYIGATDDPAEADIDCPIPVMSSNRNASASWTTLRNYANGISPISTFGFTNGAVE